MPCRRVEVVATVVGLKQATDTLIVYLRPCPSLGCRADITVDDGSDVLEVACWTSDAPAPTSKRKRGESWAPPPPPGWTLASPLQPLTVVRVRGRVKFAAQTGMRSLVAESIDMCADRNDEARHAIRCAELRRTTYSHPVGVAARELAHQRSALSSPVRPPPEVIVISESDSDTNDTTITAEMGGRSARSSVETDASMASFNSGVTRSSMSSYARSPSRRPRPGKAEGSRLANPNDLSAEHLRSPHQLRDYMLDFMARYDRAEPMRSFTFATLRDHAGLKRVATLVAKQAALDLRAEAARPPSQGLFRSQPASQGAHATDLRAEPEPPPAALDRRFGAALRDLIEAGLVVLAEEGFFGGDEAYQLFTPALVEPELRRRGRRALERDERWARAVVQAVKREPNRYEFLI